MTDPAQETAESPEKIAAEIVREWIALPGSAYAPLKRAIASAILAERERLSSDQRVRDAEREAYERAAKIADDFAAFVSIGPDIEHMKARDFAADGARDIRDAIRALSLQNKSKGDV